MRTWAILVGLAAAGEVAVLTKDNFDQFIEENKNVLVKFYAPWCGHCKTIAPEFEKAADKVTNARLAKVDATVETELGQRFSVQGYPTIKWFSGGSESEFDGGRTADTILEWITAMTGPAVSEDAPPETSTKPVMVQYGDAIDDAFKAAAESKRRDAAWHFVKSGDKKITIKHPHEPAIDTTDFSDVKKFFADNRFPLFGELDGESFSNYMKASKDVSMGLVWVLFPMAKGEKAQVISKYREEYMKISETFKGKFFITWTDTEAFKDAVSNMLGVESFPKVAVQLKGGDKKKFIHDGEMTVEAVTQFIQDVSDGKIEPILKSEKVPESNDKPVKVIVGSQFEEMLFHEKKDVMLEVYAPWCGHCKKLEPEWEKLGKKVVKEGLEDLLMIAKLDGTANDSPDDKFEWSGFPSIFYVKGGNKTPEKYEGERTAKGVWKWIKKHHSQASALKMKLADNKEAREKKVEL